MRQGGGLRGGYYTIPEATRLLGMDITQRATLKNWLIGNQSASGPVIARQYPNSKSELGFYDLMELRFIEHFRRHDVSLQSIRKAAEHARREMQLHHPFARSNVKFVTDRKRIFSLVAEEEKDLRLTDLVTGQQAMYDVIEGFLAKGVDFAPDGLARLWRPDTGNFPKVSISPHKAHGHPVIDPVGVPTRTIFDLWRAEQQDTHAVANWFEMSTEDVDQAVEYEVKLAA